MATEPSNPSVHTYLAQVSPLGSASGKGPKNAQIPPEFLIVWIWKAKKRGKRNGTETADSGTVGGGWIETQGSQKVWKETLSTVVANRNTRQLGFVVW